MASNTKINDTKDIKEKQKKIKKHHNIKKDIGRIIALILVISMVLAASATLIFYIKWYLEG